MSSSKCATRQEGRKARRTARGRCRSGTCIPSGRPAGFQIRRPQNVRVLPRPAGTQPPDWRRRGGAAAASGEPAHHRRGRQPPGHYAGKGDGEYRPYGNTTAATIPLVTRDAIQQGKLKKGDIALFAAVGAELPWRKSLLALGLLDETAGTETAVTGNRKGSRQPPAPSSRLCWFSRAVVFASAAL